MKAQTITTKRRGGLVKGFLYAATWTILLVFLVSHSFADTMSQAQLATGAMTQALLGDGNFLGGLYGPDNGNALQFTTFVEPTGNTFSYTLTGHYQGLDLSIVGSGKMDEKGKSWNFSSTMQVGGDLFQVNGSDSFTPTATGYSSQMDQYLGHEGVALPQPPYNDFHGGDSWGYNNGWFWGGLCYNTLDGQRSGAAWACGGYWNSPTDWEQLSPSYDFGFGITLIGSSPGDGGAGTFAMDVNTPEPSSLFLMGSGVVGLGGFLRRRFLG